MDGRARTRLSSPGSEAQRDFNHSRPLDVHRWSEHPEVHRLVGDLWTQHFLDFETDTGLPGQRPKGHPKRQLRVLLLDLYVAWRNDPELCIGVQMTNSGYRPNSRYNALNISKVMIGLVHRAHDVGLIGFQPGSEFAGRTSRIWASDTLASMFRSAKFGLIDIWPFHKQESIILSLGGGKWREYEDTLASIGARQQVDDYNKLLHATFVDVPVLDTPVLSLPPKLPGRRPTKLQITQNDKHSKRIYYRGDWELGGRLHGGFWQRMPKVWRPHLFINDLPTVEDDYSGLHIALLYGIEGETLEGDAYTLDLPTAFSSTEMRGLVKSLSLMAINAQSERKAFQAFRADQETGSQLKRLTNQDLSMVLDGFKQRHPAIAGYLCSDQGVALMAIDGRITMRIIEQFTRERVPLLSLFDSYIVDAFHAPELRSAMAVAMDAEVPGASTSFRRIGAGYDEILDTANGDTEGLLGVMSSLMGGVVKTEGYRARRQRFYDWRSGEVDWNGDVQRSIDQFRASAWSG